MLRQSVSRGTLAVSGTVPAGVATYRDGVLCGDRGVGDADQHGAGSPAARTEGPDRTVTSRIALDP
jgi:hypothetical protein